MINSAIYPDLALKKLSDNFLSWADATTVYGVNFADVSDAANFIEALNNAIDACKADVAPVAAAPSKPTAKGGLIGELNSKLAKKPAPTSSSYSSPTVTRPAAGSAGKPSPVAAKPTAVASAKAGPEPGNKGSLRENGASGWAAARAPGAAGSQRKDTGPGTTTTTTTSPTSTPAPAAVKPVAKPAASTYARLMGASESEPSKSPTSTGITTSSSGRDLLPPRKEPSSTTVAATAASAAPIDYEALKQEMLSAFREELEHARQEILDAVREVRGS